MIHWVYSREHHQNGGQHYHVALKLFAAKRWKIVKESLEREENIIVHFSDRHDNYHSAYKYVCKEDCVAYHSKWHPNLADIASPPSKHGTVANCRHSEKKKRAQVCDTGEKLQFSISKVRRLSNLEVSEHIISHNIRRENELFADANTRKLEGQKDLANFIMNLSTKAISDLLETIWRMHTSAEELNREKISQLQLIREASEGECIEECNGIWLSCAQEVLSLNSINIYVYAAALIELIQKGRGKFRNVMLVGPTNDLLSIF